jgi:hypothetical protein
MFHTNVYLALLAYAMVCIHVDLMFVVGVVSHHS